MRLAAINPETLNLPTLDLVDLLEDESCDLYSTPMQFIQRLQKDSSSWVPAKASAKAPMPCSAGYAHAESRAGILSAIHGVS
jgi:hypothetical protein